MKNLKSISAYLKNINSKAILVRPDRFILGSANSNQEFNSIINDYDVIISPTFGKNQMLITNLTGHPVISVPNGFDKKGNPTSISFIGNYHNEDKILYLASLYQSKTKFHRNIPSGF